MRHPSSQAALLLVLVAVLGSSTDCQAQRRWRYYGGYGYGGATPASTIMNAYANIIEATGHAAVDFSVARINHAQAAEHEMRNQIQWVHTYFQKRQLNREYRRKENPIYIDREEKRHGMVLRRLIDQEYMVLDHDIPDETLNTLLRELTGMSLLVPFLTSQNSAVNTPIAASDIEHIRFTDGAHKYGHKLTFSASDGEALSTNWPSILRAPEFDADRENFELQREESLTEIRNLGKLSHEREQLLMEAVDRLTTRLELEYPPERRTAGGGALVWQRYRGAKLYLQELAFNVYRLMETKDQTALAGGLAFQGDSVGKVVLHMLQHGIEFAPPEAGDERVYRNLYVAMRNIYLELKQQEQQEQQAQAN